MIRPLSDSPLVGLHVVVHPRAAIAERLPTLDSFVRAAAPIVPLSKQPAWLEILRTSLGHEPYAIEAIAHGRTYGYLPLALVSSVLFGRFLVSLPYLNSNGV